MKLSEQNGQFIKQLAFFDLMIPSKNKKEGDRPNWVKS